MSARSALVLFSGGQDSTVCLAYALDRFDRVETIGFDYGQRHGIELECRQTVLGRIRKDLPAWADKLGEDHMADLTGFGQISETSLTRDAEITVDEAGLPSTFVPGRNLMFLTFAAAVAWRRGILTMVGGMCETDYSGYPDCRRSTLNAEELALRRGMDRPFVIDTPLMWLDKAETWELADDLGGDRLVDIIVEDTHSCYLGDRSKRHAWGYGCGKCPACDLRAKGYEKWRGQLAA
ncbi:MAG: 7-cyano-7-deazaguanine synthase QueC, partial [Pseudomonadota bacterium]